MKRLLFLTLLLTGICSAENKRIDWYYDTGTLIGRPYPTTLTLTGFSVSGYGSEAYADSVYVRALIALKLSASDVKQGAYLSDTGKVNYWDGGSTGLTAATGRTSLGLNNGALVDTVEFGNKYEARADTNTTKHAITLSYAVDNFAPIAYVNQDVSTTASPSFVTAKLSALTDNYIPYHVNDATGLANSPIRTDGTGIGIDTAAISGYSLYAKGKIGFGSYASDAWMRIEPTISSSSDLYGLFLIAPVVHNDANSSANYAGIVSNTNVSDVNLSSNNFTGYFSGATLASYALTSSKNINYLSGAIIAAGNIGRLGAFGNITYLKCADIYYATAGGTITSGAGVWIRNPSGVGTITTNYGVYIEDQTRGVTNYSIYSEGGQNYFGGLLGIGYVPTTTKLGIKNALFANATEWYNSRGTLIANLDSTGAFTKGSLATGFTSIDTALTNAVSKITVKTGIIVTKIAKDYVIEPDTTFLITKNDTLGMGGGGGGTGTVTSVATSDGILGGTITTTGTIKADTTFLVTKWDTTASRDLSDAKYSLKAGSSSIVTIGTITTGTVDTTYTNAISKLNNGIGTTVATGGGKTYKVNVDTSVIVSKTYGGNQYAVKGTAVLKATMPTVIGVACSDETTALTNSTSVAKVTFRVPYAVTVTAVRASVTTAPTGATILVDIHESGTTILSTKIMIDAGELTSTTATTGYVLSDTALADDAEITVFADQVGSSVAGAGLKIWIIGTRIAP